MNKTLKITIATGAMIISFMAGGLVSTQITSRQNREIWTRILELIESGNIVTK